MIPYSKKLKPYSQKLRTHQTDCEKILWNKIRKKQVLGVQFYRQKPLAKFIVDFYAPSVKLIIELDGSQHFQNKGLIHDQERDSYFTQLGLKVMRFHNNEIINNLEGVLTVIYQYIQTNYPPPL